MEFPQIQNIDTKDVDDPRSCRERIDDWFWYENQSQFEKHCFYQPPHLMRKLGKRFTYYNENEDNLPSWTRISRLVYAFLLWNYMIVEILDDPQHELYEFKYLYKQTLLLTAILMSIGAKQSFEEFDDEEDNQ